ncbi:MAG: phospholipase A [Hydrogenovibrio sp.]|nr:phospholipase A [Hydrogenovibrio sp.]
MLKAAHFIAFSTLWFATCGWADPSLPQYDAECVQKALEKQAPDTTLQQVRDQCILDDAELHSGKTALDARLLSEKRNKYGPFSIQPYRPNYLIIGAYNFDGTNERPFQQAGLTQTEQFEPFEAKFQISLKIPITDDLLGWGDHLYVGYTNRSFWQAYNHNISAPFRETNHEPEIWMSFDNKMELFGWRNRLIDIGLSHQSNGRSEPLSRSWNRVYARLLFARGNSVFAIKPWLRLPETSSTDDNPDIEHYMGNVEFGFLTKYHKHHFKVMVRDNFSKNDNKGAFELGYSYPVHRNMKAYIQWFYGYGESLIDYNYRNNSVGIGMQFSSWL